METIQEKIKRVTQEEVAIVHYDSNWIKLFEKEKLHLLSCLPKEIIKRIEHFGSTSIPNLPSKPIIDILVEVSSLEDTKNQIVPILESQGYDYFWRPSWDDGIPPFYAWFIKRDSQGNRTHHIHMVEKQYEHWDRLYFRDYLIEKPNLAKEYANLKKKLSKEYGKNRIAYTKAKTNFISRVTIEAKKYYKNGSLMII